MATLVSKANLLNTEQTHTYWKVMMHEGYWVQDDVIMSHCEMKLLVAGGGKMTEEYGPVQSALDWGQSRHWHNPAEFHDIKVQWATEKDD